VYVSVQIVLFQIIFWPRMLLFLASSIKTPHRGCCWLTTDTQLMSPNIAAAQAPNAAIPASQQFQVEYDKQVNMPSSCSSSNSWPTHQSKTITHKPTNSFSLPARPLGELLEVDVVFVISMEVNGGAPPLLALPSAVSVLLDTQPDGIVICWPA